MYYDSMTALLSGDPCLSLSTMAPTNSPTGYAFNVSAAAACDDADSGKAPAAKLAALATFLTVSLDFGGERGRGRAGSGWSLLGLTGAERGGALAAGGPC